MLKSEQIQNRINELTTAINAGDSDVQLTLWEMERTEKRKELDIALAEEAQQNERVQAQTEKVESITLPMDFNDLLDNPLANEMIIEVVKQFQLQAYDEHNAEIQRLSIAWNQSINESNRLSEELLRVAEEHKAELQTTISSLTYELESEKSMYAELEANYQHLQTILNQANMDKADAETKRDNAIQQATDATNAAIQAVNEQNALKTQIEALQQELTAKKALTVNGNDKLAELASKAKESTIEKANIGLARWKEKYGLDLPLIDIPSLPEAQPLAMPEIPAAQEGHTFQENHTPTITEGDTSATGNQPLEQVVAKDPASTEEVNAQMREADLYRKPVTRVEHEALRADVEAIKAHIGMVA